MKSWIKKFGMLLKKTLRYALDQKIGLFGMLLVMLLISLIIAAALGLTLFLPAFILWLAWNWVIPVFGGPAIGYWVAVGLVILLGIVGSFFRKQ